MNRLLEFKSSMNAPRRAKRGLAREVRTGDIEPTAFPMQFGEKTIGKKTMRKVFVILLPLTLDIFGSCPAAPAPRTVYGNYTVTYNVPNSPDQRTDTLIISTRDATGYFKAILKGSNISLVGLARPNSICMSMLNVTPTSFTYCFNYKLKRDRNGTIILTYPIDATRNPIRRGDPYQALDSIQLRATVRKSKLSAAARVAE